MDLYDAPEYISGVYAGIWCNKNDLGFAFVVFPFLFPSHKEFEWRSQLADSMRADSPEERFGIMNLAVFLGVRE